VGKVKGLTSYYEKQLRESENKTIYYPDVESIHCSAVLHIQICPNRVVLSCEFKKGSMVPQVCKGGCKGVGGRSKGKEIR
jgi:hypothetical protein